MRQKFDKFMMGPFALPTIIVMGMSITVIVFSFFTDTPILNLLIDQFGQKNADNVAITTSILSLSLFSLTVLYLIGLIIYKIVHRRDKNKL